MLKYGTKKKYAKIWHKEKICKNMAQRKSMQKYGTLIFMFIMVAPTAVKTGSKVTMRFVNHHLAPNE